MVSHNIETREIVRRGLQFDPVIAQKVSINYMIPAVKIDNGHFQKYADIVYEIGDIQNKIDVSKMIYISTQ